MKKLSFWFVNILLFIVILLVVGGGAVIYFCHVDRVECYGTEIYTSEEIAELILDDKYSTNSVYVFAKNLITPVEGVPFIREFKVRLKGPNTVVIEAVEKRFYGCIERADGKYVYYNKKGDVYEFSDFLIGNPIMVKGLTPKKPVVGEPMNVGKSNLKTLLTLQNDLKEAKINVSRIDFTEDGTIMLTYGTIMINLGTRANISQKIRRLPYVLPYIQDRAGTLHLEEWSEENTDIVFEEGLAGVNNN